MAELPRALRGMQRLLLASSAIVAGAAAGSERPCAQGACAQGACAAPRRGASTDAVLLQYRSGLDRSLAAAASCEVGEAVPCPGSAAYCAGEQCCPGAAPGDLTFPCPSAPPGWGLGLCQSPEKVEDCLVAETADPTLAPPVVPPTVADTTTEAAAPTSTTPASTTPALCSEFDVVACPGDSGAYCSGSQCCPPATPGGPTFPCPSAPVGWGPGQCQMGAKIEDCVTGVAPPTTTSTEGPPISTTTEVPPVAAKPPTGSKLVVVNECQEMGIWIASLIPEEFRGFFPILQKLQPGESYTYNFPTNTTVVSTRFWPKWGCNEQGTDCLMGDSGGPGHPPCPPEGCAPPVDSKFEATFWDKNTAQPVDWWDTSGVDGYTLPFKLELDSGCPRGVPLDCSNLGFSDCPGEELLAGTNMSLQVRHNGEVVGCYSTCGKLTYSHWGNTPSYSPYDPEALMYCCPTPPVSPEACSTGPVESSKYVALFRSRCNHVYSYAYDDKIGLQTCPVGTTYTWRLYCPS